MAGSEWIDLSTALLAALSAGLWAKSARVNFKFGYDMDAELDQAMKSAASWNCRAATVAAFAAFCPVVKSVLLHFHLIN